MKKLKKGLTNAQVAVSIGAVCLMIFGALILAQKDGRKPPKGFVTYLQHFFEDGKNFERLSFRVPGGSLSCESAFCVVPDKTFSGEPSKGNDVLYVVVRASVTPDIRLSAPLEPGGTTVSIESADGKNPLTTYIAAGELLLLSGKQSAEMIQIPASLPSGPSGPLELTAKSAAIDPLSPTFATGGKAAIRGSYAKGDPVFKAKILKVGYAPDTKELRAQEMGGNSAHLLARGITRFALSYDLPSAGAPATCAPLATKDSAFARDWNGVAHSRCASALAHIKIDLAGEDRVPAEARDFTGAPVEGSYVVGMRK